ncbi:MAG: sugar ABC transporter permease [Chloroflexi bacterium]|nr:MAG: sugar ABC transporter permease [Chloroflexota bacterium]
MIAPAVIFIALLVGVPLGLAVYLSLTDATAGSLTGDWVGLHNFVDAWHNPNFRTALENTIVFTLVTQALIVVGAAVLAHALIRPFRGRWLVRFLILLPWAAPVALSTIGFLWILDSQFSVLNWTLVHDVLPGGGHLYLYKPVNWLLGVIDHLPWVHTGRINPFNPPQWLGQATLAKISIIVIQAWRILPFATVIFLAGLSSIPAEIEDAARIDGATAFRKFWYVTLPLQLPIAVVTLLFGIVFTATDMTVVYVLTNGGPFNSTQVLTTWAYQTGIVSSSLGQGAAVSLYLLPVLVVIAVLMLRFARRVEVT